MVIKMRYLSLILFILTCSSCLNGSVEINEVCSSNELQTIPGVDGAELSLELSTFMDVDLTEPLEKVNDFGDVDITLTHAKFLSSEQDSNLSFIEHIKMFIVYDDNSDELLGSWNLKS